MLQPALNPNTSAFAAMSPVGFSGRSCANGEFVTRRDMARDETAALLESKNVPAILAEKFDATLWHILRHTARGGREVYYLTLDRRNNDTLKRIAESPEKLELLKDWLAEKKPALQDDFEAARKQSEETGDSRSVHRWIRLNRKAIDWFVNDRQKEFSAELSHWLDENRDALTALFAKALNLHGENISLLPRLVDTCCFARCTSCLNSRPELRKSWVV